MNATEIQKNFFQEKIPELKKEKKSTLLKLKKKREKSKPKKNPLKSKKVIKKKFIQKKIKKNINSISDDISLDTNSTLITLDEESNINNSDMVQYLDEIELVLKDIYSKRIYFKNLNNFIKNENGQFKEKNVNVKFLKENLKNWTNNLSNSDKINLILDIDETLVYSKMVKELQIGDDINQIIENLQKNEKDDDIHYIKLELNDKIFIFKVHVRKNMTEFFKALNPYCNFYINTMASPLYVKEVVNILYKNYGFRLSNISENTIIYTTPQNKKIIPQEIEKNGNFLILDDNICAWELKYISSIIPIRKFRSDNNEIKNIFYQYYLFSNKIYCFDETKRPFLNKVNQIPYCVENLTNEKSQLYHIIDIFKKSFLLSKILEIPISHALHFFQNTILKDYYIFYDGYDTNFIFDMINLLGGSITKDKKIATHIIYNKNSITDNKNDINYNDKHVLEVKWIFDCFFNFMKCDVYDSEYKIQ